MWNRNDQIDLVFLKFCYPGNNIPSSIWNYAYTGFKELGLIQISSDHRSDVEVQSLPFIQ